MSGRHGGSDEEQEVSSDAWHDSLLLLVCAHGGDHGGEVDD